MSEKISNKTEKGRSGSRHSGWKVLEAINKNIKWRRDPETQEYSDVLLAEPDTPKDITLEGIVKDTIGEMLANYEEKIALKSSSLLSLGTITAIEGGYLGYSTPDLITKGVRSQDGDGIQKRLNLNISNFDLDDATKEKTVRTAEYEIDLGIHRIASHQVDQIPEEQIKQAMYNGSLEALRTGARIDEGGNVVYSISTSDGKPTRDFMERVGIDFTEYKPDGEPRQCSYSGFANILSILKDEGPEETEKGFKVLDWYYDNFEYAKHLDDFTNTMDDYCIDEGMSWLNKYEEYVDRREEIRRHEELNKNKGAILDLDSVEEVTVEDVEKTVEELQKEMEKYSPIINLDETFDKNHHEFSGINSTDEKKNKSTKQKSYISALKKTEKLREKLPWFKMIDEGWPNENGEREEGFGIYSAQFNDKNGKKSKYFIVTLVHNSHNIAVAIPVAEKSNDAAYVWIGDLSEGKLAWKDHFSDTKDKVVASKSFSRNDSNIRAHSHRANNKLLFDPLDNLWFHICKDIEQRVGLPS